VNAAWKPEHDRQPISSLNGADLAPLRQSTLPSVMLYSKTRKATTSYLIKSNLFFQKKISCPLPAPPHAGKNDTSSGTQKNQK
jgi:hypothetical protein